MRKAKKCGKWKILFPTLPKTCFNQANQEARKRLPDRNKKRARDRRWYERHREIQREIKKLRRRAAYRAMILGLPANHAN